MARAKKPSRRPAAKKRSAKRKSSPKAAEPVTAPIPAPVYAWGGGPISDPKRDRLLAQEQTRIDRLRRELGESMARYAAIRAAPATTLPGVPVPLPPPRKRKPKAPPLKPRAWFRDAESDTARARDLEYLSRTVKDLRDYYRGFESKDGYNEARIPEWTGQQVARVRQMGEDLHSLQARQHTRVVPDQQYKNKKKRETFKKRLRKVTGQTHPQQYAWVYPIQTTLRKVDVVLNDRGNLEEHDHITGTYIKTERWYFRDYAKGNVATEKQFMAAARKMLKVIPHHLFLSFFTDRDVIGSPFEAVFLLEELAGYFVKSYAAQGEWLLGVINQGSRERTLKLYGARLDKRMKHQRAKSKAGAVARRRRKHEIARINRWRKEFGGNVIPQPKPYEPPASVKKEKELKKPQPSASPAMQAIRDSGMVLVYDLTLNGKVISTHDSGADALKARDRLIAASGNMLTRDDFMTGVRRKK